MVSENQEKFGEVVICKVCGWIGLNWSVIIDDCQERSDKEDGKWCPRCDCKGNIVPLQNYFLPDCTS